MPRPQNRAFGRCACRRCDGVAEVRRLKNHDRGDRYLYCPACGEDRNTSRARNTQAVLDAWIDAHTLPEPAEPAEEPGTEAQAQQQQQEPEEPAASRGEPARNGWIDNFI